MDRFVDFALAPAVPQPQTWQVPRARFDELLLRHAQRCGADVREGFRVTDIGFDAEGVTVTCGGSDETGRASESTRGDRRVGTSLSPGAPLLAEAR